MKQNTRPYCLQSGIKQPDHAILSTALFFRLNEVLFVSDDINLRNKSAVAQPEHTNSKSYTPRLVPAAAPGIHPRKQIKKTKEMKP